VKTIAKARFELNGRRYEAGDIVSPADAAPAIDRGWARNTFEEQDGELPSLPRKRSQATTPVDAIKALDGAPERK